MKKIIATITAAAAALAATPVFAGPVTQVMQNTVQPLLQSAIYALIAVLLGLLTAWAKKKFGLQISDALLAQAQQAATNAVLAVEEKAAAAVEAGGDKWAAGQKYKAALDMLAKAVPAVTAEQADVLIHAAIAKLPGVGASNIPATPVASPAGTPAAS